MMGLYRIVISHGVGRSYLRGNGFNKVTHACGYARELAEAMNAVKSKKAPKVTVTVMRVVGEYNGKA